MNSLSLPARLGAVLVAAICAACSDSQQAAAPAPQPTVETAAPASAPPPPPAATAAVQKPSKAPAAPDLSARTVELQNPDDASMVFLYQDIAGLTPQFDQWVELDNRVRSGDPRDRAALRETVRAELEAAANAVNDVGLIRLSLHSADLSHYDPTYGEFVVGALAPSSVIEYKAFGQKVNLKFANGRTAQIWKVPPEQGQAIDDRLSNYNKAKLDVLVQVRSVVPGPGGGSIMADVIEYELRDARDDSTIGRVNIPQ